METLYTIIFVIFVTVIFSLISQKQKKSSWEGTLIKKNINDDQETGVTTYYLIFKTNSGKKKVNLSSASKVFNQWNIGDQAIKKSGEYLPEKRI